ESPDPTESIVLPAAEPAAGLAGAVDDGPSGEIEGADGSDDSDDGFEPPEPRPIPVPHDLAELAAEAVRRPDDGSAPANDELPAPAGDEGTVAGRSEPSMPDSGAALIPPSEPPAPPEVPSWPHPEPLRLPPPPEPPTPTDSIGQE
ncbi:MAG TPA: hypothetical protein DCM67_09665, partial [Propionibacteriaceae bacterium]|nr:hypothetical protein [Propionibacteriaceae bacterium]